MNRRELIWTKAAEADLQTIYEYHEESETGRGDRFLALIDDALELLRVFPEMAPVYSPPFRRLQRHRQHELQRTHIVHEGGQNTVEYV